LREVGNAINRQERIEATLLRIGYAPLSQHIAANV
jgi:hypothetical protein